jgi:hypothetical protein
MSPIFITLKQNAAFSQLNQMDKATAGLYFPKLNRIINY